MSILNFWNKKKENSSAMIATLPVTDVVYGYLHKNNEEKGFNDAMVKSDLTFRDMNMSIIRNKILMVFREINLNYDVMKRDLEIRMDTCSAAGLLSTVSELEKSMSTIKAHKACGFLRGIATIALGNTAKAATVPQMTIPANTNMVATA